MSGLNLLEVLQASFPERTPRPELTSKGLAALACRVRHGDLHADDAVLTLLAGAFDCEPTQEAVVPRGRRFIAAALRVGLISRRDFTCQLCQPRSYLREFGLDSGEMSAELVPFPLESLPLPERLLQ